MIDTRAASAHVSALARLIMNTNRVVCLLRVSNGSVRELGQRQNYHLNWIWPANVGTRTHMQPGEHQSFQRHTRPCCCVAGPRLQTLFISCFNHRTISWPNQHAAVMHGTALYATSVLINYFRHRWISHALLGVLCYTHFHATHPSHAVADSRRF
jgi:hypothetical protein